MRAFAMCATRTSGPDVNPLALYGFGRLFARVRT